MDGFTIIDAAVAGVIVISAILAYSRGLVRELMAIVGWIAAAFLAFIFAPTAVPLIREVPYLGDFIRDSCELGIIASFAGVFAIALLIMSIFTPLFAIAVQRSVLGGFDAALGFIFGTLRGVLLVLVALVAYDRIVAGDGVDVVEDSRSIQIFAAAQDRVEQALPDDAPEWILGRYNDLIGNCDAIDGEDGTGTDEARVLVLPPARA